MRYWFALLCLLALDLGARADWLVSQENPSLLYWARDGKLTAVFNKEIGEFRRIDPDTGNVQVPELPPWKREQQNFGVETSKIPRGESLQKGGCETVPCAAAREAEPSIPEDRFSPRVLAIGSNAETAVVVKAFDTLPELAAWKGKAVVHAHQPGDWQVRTGGYKSDGHPTVYVMASNGLVTHRQDDWNGDVSGIVEGLRRASPDYDPQYDSDWRGTLLTRYLGKLNLPMPECCLALLVALGALFGGRKT